MIFFLVAFGLLLHVLYWGAGLAALAMPRPWHRFWPALAMPAGFTLQSLVVWVGAYANLPGTNSYAWWSELVPLALLGAAWRWRGAPRLVSDLSRFGVVAAAMAGCLGLIVLPMALAAKGLTTMSLGSCDAADYAAGARVFMEFAHSDRSGFLGLTEVAGVASADNFFDFWLRLNHFTPSALIALNGTVFHCAPHELTGVLTAVLLAASMPVVFWLARAVMNYSGGVSVAVALLYGLSPIGWYAVAHVTMGQWLAAQAIGLLTWAGVALWRGRLDARRALAFSGVLAIAYALILGSYNFILLVCLVPAVAYAGGLAMWVGEWHRLVRWGLAMLLPLAVSGAIFFERVAGLVERFQLFQAFDFGWRIPALTPEGWLGMVSGPELQPWHVLGLRWLLAAGVAALLGWAFARAVRLQRRGAWTAVCLAAPVLVGYAYLEIRGARTGTNASYDAYKLFAVFHPELLAASCWWVTLRRGSQRLGEWFVVAAAAAVVLGLNLLGDGMFFFHLMKPPLVVGAELKQLRKIEAMTDVKSLNLLVPDMWSRLWANEFLLRKPQYFLTHTYEGRRNTPLRGDWDLEGGLIAVKPPGEARRQITAHYALVDTRSPQFVRATLNGSWYDEERDPKNGERWRWSRPGADILLENPQHSPVRLRITLDGWSLGGPRYLSLVLAGAAPSVPTPGTLVGTERRKTSLPEIIVPPGRSILMFSAPQPPREPSVGGIDGDPRSLEFCVFGLELEVTAAK